MGSSSFTLLTATQNKKINIDTGSPESREADIKADIM